MKLTSAKIRNFRGIEEWNITFEPGFNLIKGVNGRGKTSVLEAIAVGLGGFVAGLAIRMHYMMLPILRFF